MIETKLRFRYVFDEDGFYKGLVYKNSVGLFPTNSTELEPNWKPGFSPVWDFENRVWKLVKRGERRVISVGAESVRVFGREALKSIDKRLSEFEDFGVRPVTSSVQLLIVASRDTRKSVEKLVDLVETQHDIEHQCLIRIIEQQNKTILLLQEMRKSFWVRFKEWIFSFSWSRE